MKIFLRFLHHNKHSLIVSLISTLGSLFLIESALSYQNHANYFAVASSKLGQPFNRQSRKQFIADLKSKNLPAYPVIGGNFFLEHPLQVNKERVVPLRGISNALIVGLNENGSYYPYQSDEYGFNNSNLTWKNFHHMTVLGDSFIEASSIPSDKNIVALLRTKYPDALNLGVTGNGPLLMLATLKEYIRDLRPSIVLWCYYEGNDLNDLNNEKKNEILLKYLEATFKQDLKEKKSQIENAFKEYLTKYTPHEESFLNKIKLRGSEILLLFNLRHCLFNRYYQIPVDMDLFQRVLHEAKRYIASWGGQLYFVYLPTWDRYGTRLSPHFHREEVLKVVLEEKLHLIDLVQVFTQHRDPLSLFPFRQRGHYNIEGHEVVAGAILKELENKPNEKNFINFESEHQNIF